ncbi:protein ACCELERATED CELL DEATH 6-like [Papaver somniferum]|uniref:protein ACCELERATED CELL DEATH 6-like n=1 Tax=Papaver somniferum TaxID=3469 RepID=UPI000E6FD403|nr:protein ACCELERATED CELL DEATH 6-like [Papaver somniferum]
METSTETQGALAAEICISIENQSAENDMNFHVYRPLLLRAAVEGKWELMRYFVTNFHRSVEVPITTCGRTALHVATGAGHSVFALELLKHMSVEALELKDSYDGNTALHLAVIAGLEEVVKEMVKLHRNLTRIDNKKGLNPLFNAAIHVGVGHTEVIRFLCDVIMEDGESSSFRGHLGARLICNVTRADLYELAYNLIGKHQSLATARDDDGNTMLDELAEKGYTIPWPSDPPHSALSFPSNIQEYENTDKPSTCLKVQYLLNPEFQDFSREQYRSSIILELVNKIFEKISCMNEEDKRRFFYDSKFLKTAAKTGSIEIVKKCFSTYPDQFWIPHEGRNILQIAVENRQDNTFDYLCGHMKADEKILTTWIVESNGGNILHVAAKIAPPARLNIFKSPVIQMHSEIKWFKKVEKRVSRALRKMRNDQGETPEEVFTREHRDLVKKAETYMLRIAESCLVVAALVATVAFAAPFTLPGGNYSDDAANKGKPIFLEKNSFVAFMVVDALALFSSTTSILVFLSVFTGSCAKKSFEIVLPRKLAKGLRFLVVSVVSVILAFTIAISIILGNRYVWAPYVIGVVAFYSTFYLSSYPLWYLFKELNHVYDEGPKYGSLGGRASQWFHVLQGRMQSLVGSLAAYCPK